MIRSSRTLVLCFALVFVSGLVVGALGFRYYKLTVVSREQAPPPSPEQFRKMFVEDLSKRLELTASERRELEAILDQTRKKFNEMRMAHRPEEDAIRQEQVDKIRAILSPKQQLEYEKFRKEREDRRKKSGPPPARP